MKSPDIYALMDRGPEAKAYFDKLPDYVSDQIYTQAENVNSFASRQDYAENVTRGDG